MEDDQNTATTAQDQRQRRMRPLALFAIAPIALGLLVTPGCTAIEDTTDYIGDLFSYVEDDDEIFGSDAVPGDDSYRSLSEVPSEAPRGFERRRARPADGRPGGGPREGAAHGGGASCPGGIGRVDDAGSGCVQAGERDRGAHSGERRIIVPGVLLSRANGAPAAAGVPCTPPHDRPVETPPLS